MSTNTIILLILGLVILVVLIFGFTTGWSSFKNIVSPTNVDSVVEDCQTVCGLNQEFSYCSAQRTLRINEEKVEVKTSCAVLAGISDFKRAGVSSCPEITCDLTCDEILITGKVDGEVISKDNFDLTPLTGVDCSP